MICASTFNPAMFTCIDFFIKTLLDTLKTSHCTHSICIQIFSLRYRSIRFTHLIDCICVTKYYFRSNLKLCWSLKVNIDLTNANIRIVTRLILWYICMIIRHMDDCIGRVLNVDNNDPSDLNIKWCSEYYQSNYLFNF